MKNILFLLGLVAGCMQQKDFNATVDGMLSGSVPLIYTDELLSKLNGVDDFVLLDAREIEEYTVSHLPRAKFLGYENFSEELIEGFDKEVPVIVYCSVGYRSEKIGEELLSAGFERVYNLYGGIFLWKNKGHQVVNSAGVETDSVHTYSEKWSKWLKKGIKVYE